MIRLRYMIERASARFSLLGLPWAHKLIILNLFATVVGKAAWWEYLAVVLVVVAL